MKIIGHASLARATFDGLRWPGVLAAFVGLLLLTFSVTSVQAKDDDTKKDMSQQEKEEMLETRDDSPKNGIIRQKVALQRDSDSILKAFVPAISQAPDSAVEIVIGEVRVALGTVVSSDGEIITKASQVTGSPMVRLASGDLVEPRVVGIDLRDDLALLKIEGYSLDPIRWDAAVDPEVGAWVISSLPGKNVGSIGIVGVKPREIPKERGALGIRMDEQAEGVVVSDFSAKETPAKKAGVQIGDRITEINNEPVVEISDLQRAVQSFLPGEVVVLTVERDDTTISLEVVLDTLSVIDEASKHREMQETLGAELSLFRSGFTKALQHDSPLMPADCGGPLLDLAGNPVGINIARAGRVSSYSLPIQVLEQDLVTLRSGDVSPDKVFARRITRLNEAVTRLATQIDSDFTPQLSKLNDELETLKVEAGEARQQVDVAQSRLDEVNQKIDELNSSRDNLDKQIQALQEKRNRYQATIEALSKGIRVN